jgi:hypothetical protein
LVTGDDWFGFPDFASYGIDGSTGADSDCRDSGSFDLLANPGETLLTIIVAFRFLDIDKFCILKYSKSYPSSADIDRSDATL